MESPIMRLPSRFNRNFSHRLSVDCYVPLDATLTIDENIVIVLDNLVPENSLAKARQLGHLNNLVSLLRKGEESNFPIKVLLCALRLLLTSESKELRTAGLRCLRHSIKNRQEVRILYHERIEYFIVKCLDICMENETERVQALRLVRHLASLDPLRMPRIITHSLASVCNSSDDSLRCVSVETVCEIALMNPKAFGDFDVISLLLHSAMDIEQAEKLSEMLFGVVLHLLNRTETWSPLDLEYVISPLMEIYFHHPKPGKGLGLEEERIENRLNRCRMALNTILRSWTGVSRLCTPNPCGIRSLINLLCISNSKIQHFIMDLLLDQLFAKKLKVHDEDFAKTVSIFVESDTESWTLRQGFVVREGIDMLKSEQNSTFVDHHRSLLLSCLLQTGLCETLVDVATGSKVTGVGIQATILLAEVLDLCQSLLPAMYETVSICTSSLLSNSASSVDLAIKSKARQTVNRLHEHQLIKSRRVENSSLFLQAILYQTKSEKPPLHQPRDLEPVEPVLRDFQGIFPRDNRIWDWDIISMVLDSAYDLPKTVEDEGHFRFVRRLFHFFKPSSRLYVIIRLDEDYAHSLTVLACQLIVFLVQSDNSEAAVILFDFLGDIAHCLKEVTKDTVTGDPLLGPNRIRNSLSQHYFLMIGHLTHYPSGEKFLERSGLVEALMDLIGVTLHADYVKLAISALCYGNNPVGKILLCKALTGSCEDARIYSCQFLALLMRLKVPGVQDWGMNLLVTELLDQSSLVSDTALKILENLCEDHDLLEILITTLPPLMHLSDKGIFLLARLMSLPSGFKVFSEAQVLRGELRRWSETMNEDYVRVDEAHREAAFGAEERVEISYPLVHLYGQLVQHEEGFELVTRQDCIGEYIKCLKKATTASTDAETLALKTALWVLGHLGSSASGADWLEQEGVLSMVLTLSTCSPNLIVRATAFSAVNLIARSDRGRALVELYGWRSLLHERPGTSSHSSSFSSGSGSFSNSDIFPDSFRKPLYTVSSCPEVHDNDRIDVDVVKRDRGQSDSVVHLNSNHNNNLVVRSATVSTCSSSTRTSDSDPVQSHDRTVSVAPSVVSWPRMGKTGTVVSDPGDVGYRPYYRSFSALVGSQANDAFNRMFNNDLDRSIKLYLVDKISGRKIDNRGLCVPVPIWNLFQVDAMSKREEIPETVLEGTNADEGISAFVEIRKRILQMCGLRGQKTTENELLKLKQKHPEVFLDEKLYDSICQLLNEHYFGQSARRFIQELFLDVKFPRMLSEARAMFDDVRPQFAKSEETIL